MDALIPFGSRLHTLLSTQEAVKYIVKKNAETSCIVTAHALANFITPNIRLDRWMSIYPEVLTKTPNIMVIYFNVDNSPERDFDYEHVAIIYYNRIYDSYYEKRFLESRPIPSNINFQRIAQGLDWDLLVPEYQNYNSDIPKIADFYIPPGEINIDAINERVNFAIFSLTHQTIFITLL